MQKKIPIRQCMGCRERRPKPELIRVVRQTDGTLCNDHRGKVPGRGAYICPDPQCLARAVKSRAIERNLETPVPEELLEKLTKEMEAPHA